MIQSATCAGTIEEAGKEDEDGRERGRRREAHERPPKPWVVPTGDRIEPEVEQTYQQEGGPEKDRVRSERAGDGDGRDEHGDHRPEHTRPDHTLLGLEDVREPCVARPRPPERGEHEQSMTDPDPREVVGHQLGHLREGVDEDEIEEELERCHPLLSLGHRTVCHRSS